ncbi:hypothetical protein ACFFQF_09300 [Haladaptatus pallidirubidus]|uniref:hypothetical protein n=1 Tax=Haladaptatus pallidirubidus TaxID=1008152 RepID=UPI0031E50331
MARKRSAGLTIRDGESVIMGRYPRTVRDAQIKCIDCNAPVVQTVENAFICVGCGESPISENHQSARN